MAMIPGAVDFLAFGTPKGTLSARTAAKITNTGRKSCAIAGLILVIWSASFQCWAQASSAKVPERFKGPTELVRELRCQEAWNELWKIAADGDYYALYLLTGSAVVHTFGLSGASKSEADKIFLPMVFYATLAQGTDDQPFTTKSVRRIIPHIVGKLGVDANDRGTAEVMECLRSDADAESCVTLAIRNHLIPPYEEYIATVAKINQGTLRVHCDTSTTIHKMPRD
jgi:hypothetical protein